MADVRALLTPIRQLHERIRAAVVEACEGAAVDELAVMAAGRKDESL